MEILESFKQEYRRLHQTNAPDWAVKNKKNQGSFILPSIPFIGHEYYSSPLRIAVYASAENLSYYDSGKETNQKKLEIKEKEEISWNRHRESMSLTNGEFFPYVHIQPVTDGGLLCAALFVYNNLSEEKFNGTRHEFIEKLTIANSGKYSISGTGENKDYAGKWEYLKVSLPFLEFDFDQLQPTVVIIPGSIYKHEKVRELLKNAKVISVNQIGHFGINVHLKKYDSRAKELKENLKEDILSEWTANIGNASVKKNFYRYYAQIEERLKA